MFTATFQRSSYFSRRPVVRQDMRELEDETVDLSPPPLQSAEARERLCLKCRRPFLSTWAGHRLCRQCRLENMGHGNPNALAPLRRKGV